MAVYERIKTAGGSGTSGTATFDESPLPEGYVLVAVHFRSQAGDIATPAGWTKVGEDSTVNSRRAAVFVRRSDGTVNSITVTGSSVAWSVFLMAYASDEEDMFTAWGGAATSDFVSSIALPSPLSISTYGVTVAVARFGAAATSRTWGGGLSESIASGDNQFIIAERLGVTSFTPSLSWDSGNQQNMNLITVHIPLAPPPPEKLELTATRLSDTSVQLTWNDPGDIPHGVTIVRASGTHTLDGDSNEPEDEGYDPLTISGAEVVVENEETSPYNDTELDPGEYTYWVARSAPGD